ncbi:MFS transporter [Microlunatus endophyticus]|uniref:MFS transporter n=1 Tax=Microlunatus endophyticus TaxID=1716077 RepID=A0A917S8K8_9ACTN|nr:MFS transporter [Microlunatus endophyticus]GGL61439.1 MFS transporter [Microlunatus endophyticus]
MALRLRRTSAFLVAVTTMIAMLAGSAAPSPLYPVYRQLWGFSTFTLTVIFAVYVAALLAALLTAGSLSDQIGRRPVVGAGLVLLAAAMVLFIAAQGVGGLIAARILQGVATGLITGAVTAMIVDLQPHARAGALATGISPALGMAIGSLLSGALLQWAPWPRFLVFWILLAGDLLLALLVALMPPMPARRADHERIRFRTVLGSLRPSVGVVRAVRPAFLAQLPAVASTWALGGLYLALGSSIVAGLLGVTNHFYGAAVLAAFFASAALAAPVFRVLSESRRRPAGFGALGIGVLLTMVAALNHSLTLDIVGSVLAGLGFGLTWLTVMSVLAAATPAEHRGQTFAAVYVASYIAFSVPALVAGLAVNRLGMLPTVVGYACFDLLLVIAASVAAGLELRRRRRPIPAELSGETVDDLDEDPVDDLLIAAPMQPASCSSQS